MIFFQAENGQNWYIMTFGLCSGLSKYHHSIKFNFKRIDRDLLCFKVRAKGDLDLWFKVVL